MPISNLDEIENLLKTQKYTPAARESLLLIEAGLRNILVNVTEKLDEQTQQRVRAKELEFAKSGRGKSFRDFTLGQLIAVVRDTEFFEAWQKVSRQKFSHLTDLNRLSKLRNEIFHIEDWNNPPQVSQYEAETLFVFLKALNDVFNKSSANSQTELNEPQASSFKPTTYPGNANLIERMPLRSFGIETTKSVGWFMLTVLIGLTTVWLDTPICSIRGCSFSDVLMGGLFSESSLLIVCITIVAALLNDNVFVRCEYTKGWEKFLFSLVPIFYFGGGIATYVLFSSENNTLEGGTPSDFMIQFQLIFFTFTLFYASFIKWYGWRYGHYVCSFDVNKTN